MKAFRHIKHIVMIYKRFEEEKAELISTFFRLMGIYVLPLVCETIDEKTDLSYNCFAIVLNGDKENRWLKSWYQEDSWLYFDMENLPDGDEADSGHKKILCDLLDDMCALRLGEKFGTVFFEKLKELADLYVDQKLMLYNYHLRLVTVKPEKKEETLLAALEHFRSALSMAESFGESPHCFYFKQECKRKVNLACRLLRWLSYYNADVMIAANMDYLSRNEDVTCLWLLNGLIADEDNGAAYMAANYYQMQLDEEERLGDEEDRRFQGYTYYRMGRYYERININWKKALKYYETAYRLAPFNYRFAYKLAFACETLKDNQRAEKYYDIIMEQMQPYIEEGYLTPCKCEYAFKVARRLMFVSMRQGQYFYAKKMAELAIRIWEDIPANKFADSFYGSKEGKEIKEGMQQRLAIRRTKEELEDIEKIIGMYY